VKWVFVSLTALIVPFGVFGMGRPTVPQTVEIEGRHVSYELCHVWSDGPGDDVVVEYHDTETEIDYSDRIPRATGREIVAWQRTNKIGPNYEASRLHGRLHKK
jgi:hypothetical protein